MDGDSDIAAVASLIGDRARARVLAALGDGRALPATVLAREAGVSASTVSSHLAKLVDADLLSVVPQGRHRYFRITRPEVADALEALGRIAPAAPVRSLREGTRAQALRLARTCYDHLAGRLGVAVMDGLIRRGALVGHDGRHLDAAARSDRLAAPGNDVDYQLAEGADAVFADLRIDLPAVLAERRRRPLLRYCVDWSEQRHHLAGALGAATLAAFEDQQWVRRSPTSRALKLTPAGARELRDRLDIHLD